MKESQDENQDKDSGQLSQDQRFSYIGFEVFPDPPKDLFISKSEEADFVEGVKAKRSKGEIVRDACTLLVERVSSVERMILTGAAVLILASLFLPWYSAYNEIIEEAKIAPVAIISPDSAAITSDTLISDSNSLAASAEGTADAVVAGDELTVGDSSVNTDATDALASEQIVSAKKGKTVAELGVKGAGIRGNEEIITTQRVRKSVRREYEYVTGVGSFVAIASLGSHIFSSGIIVIISAILMLVYALLCILFPAYTLYNVYGLKGDADEVALKLKKILSYGWIPVLIFFSTIFLSLLGGSYGQETMGTFTSLGDGYGLSACLGILSWGTFISMAGFIIIAIKGVEI